MSIELGKFNQLEVVKEVDFGLYLDGGDEGEILLPTRYVPEDCKVGDMLNVFLYLDIDERLIATTLTPLVQVGQFACLEVSWVNQFGAFLNWGLMKDLFVPFSEQKMKMQVGRSYVVHAHVDEESYRIVASAKVERYLSKDMPDYAPGAEVDILIWMGFWVFMYDAPSKSKHVNKAELEYIEQDQNEAGAGPKTEEKDEKKMRFWQCFSYKQTWAFVFGKFTTDGVWWFFLFWTPSYLNSQFGIKTSDPLGMGLIFTLYAITMLSIYGGKLPTIFINKTGMNPYAARMKAMLIFAFFPLVVLLAQPLGTFSPWFPVILIGIGGAAHQSWSANIFSTVGDMFPRTAIASITGIGGMAGGIGSMILQKVAGNLFVYASGTTMVDGKEVEMTKELLEQGAQFVHPAMTFMGFEGKPAGYFVIFCVCAVAYLIGWVIMKALVPKYKPIVLD